MKATSLQQIINNPDVDWISIDLGENDIELVDKLAKALINKMNLQELYLSNNNISDEGAVKLAKSLENKYNLQVLYLGRNQIKVKGATALAQALKDKDNLQKLFLSDNKISDGGVTALAKALKNKSNLEQLYLSANKISEKGAIKLAEAFKDKDNLVVLDLSENNIVKSAEEEIINLLKKSIDLDLRLNYQKVIEANEWNQEKLSQKQRKIEKSELKEEEPQKIQKDDVLFTQNSVLSYEEKEALINLFQSKDQYGNSFVSESIEQQKYEELINQFNQYGLISKIFGDKKSIVKEDFLEQIIDFACEKALDNSLLNLGLIDAKSANYIKCAADDELWYEHCDEFLCLEEDI